MDAQQTPSRRQCGTMAVHQELLESFPEYRARQQSLETRTQERRTLEAAPLKPGGAVTISVVVHVVYRVASENITKAQITSQIAVLNKDFRAKNADKSKVPAVWKGFVADAGIEFVLAKKDPNGNPTQGITRRKTNVAGFSPSTNNVKSQATGGTDPWPTDRYLNMWVCTLSGGVLGYAQFPGGPPETDGVVILNTAFGTKGTAAAPFNMGRTTTHEVGHWLNLRHIWGDTEDCSGTDFVNDTPNAVGPNFGKPTFPHVSCNNGPNGDMFMNYMDYVDDDSMVMFTPQQVVRMAAALEDSRPSVYQP